MVVVMDTGRIDQADTAKVIFNKPKTPYVARFMGGQNVLTGKVASVAPGKVMLEGIGGAVFETADAPGAAAGARLSFAVRRDRIALHRRKAGDAALPVNAIGGTVVSTEYQGSYVKVTVDTGTGDFVANVSDARLFRRAGGHGRSGRRHWNKDEVHILSKVDTGEAGSPYLEETGH